MQHAESHSGYLYVLSKAVMQCFWCEQADTAMPMLFVIPREEILTETPPILSVSLWGDAMSIKRDL